MVDQTADLTTEPWFVNLSKVANNFPDHTDRTGSGVVKTNQEDILAAINAVKDLQKQLREQAETFNYLHKWVERGIFDGKTVTPLEALNVIAHSPSAPWKKGRWDVDHKPYAKAFYEKFPAAK